VQDFLLLGNKNGLLPLPMYKYFIMSYNTQVKQQNPLVLAIKNFFSKLKQNPDVYPIKYYKKGRRFHRHWQSPLVK
jgi:hypothetical protein